METKITSKRRLSEEKPNDLWIMIFLCIFSLPCCLMAKKTKAVKMEKNVEYRRKLRSHTKVSSASSVFLGGVMESKRKAGKMKVNLEYRRKLRSHSKISSVSSVFLGGLMSNKRKAGKIEGNVEYQRNLRSHSKISSVSDTVSLGGLMANKRKAGKIEGNSEYRRKLRSHSKISSVSSVSLGGLMENKKMEDNVEYQRKLRSHCKISSLSSVSLGSLMADKRKAGKMGGNVEYRRKLRSHSKISSLSSDGVESDLKAVSGSSHPRSQSKRLNKPASLLRGNINDSLFDHCFQNLWSEAPEEKRNACAYFNCLWFYMYSEEHYRANVLSWIKKADIFSKRYVFIPIVLWSHWSLLIFCNLGESLNSKSRTPCMLLLDSLHELDPLRVGPLIRSLIVDIYRMEGRPESSDMVQNIPLLVPEVPQQRNGDECGIFVLFYIKLFLEGAPEKFSISSGYPYFMKDDWFTEEELERFYERLESFESELVGSELVDSEPSDLESDGIERIDPGNCQG